MQNTKAKIKALIGLSLLTAGLGGCGQPSSKITQVIDAGNVIDAGLTTTSFNESIKSVIKTDKAVFMVRGMPSVFIGESATIEIADNGNRYLCLASLKQCLTLYP